MKIKDYSRLFFGNRFLICLRSNQTLNKQVMVV